MSDTTIDKILGIELKDYGTKTLKLIDVNKAKSALYDLILKEVVGEDDKDVRGTTQNPDNPAYHTKRTKFKNELRAEQRNKLKGLFDE